MESAKNVIGGQPEGDYTLKLGRHPADLPAAAGPLKRVLETESVGAARRLYEDIDSEARSYQQTYKKRGKWFVMLTAVAAIGGAIVLYLPGAGETGKPPGQTAQGPRDGSSDVLTDRSDSQATSDASQADVGIPLPISKELAGWLRWVFVGLSVLAGSGAVYFKIQLNSGQLFEKWMSRRYDAEHRRNDYFKTVYERDDPKQRDPQKELDLPSLRFEYFRRYQLDVQRIYFDCRGERHDKAAGKLIGWEGLLAAGAALVTGLWAHSEILGDTAAVLALIGVLIPTLVSARSSLSMLSQDQRHAARYKTNKETLLDKSKEIDGIRSELEAGEEAKARSFADEVCNTPAFLDRWIR